MTTDLAYDISLALVTGVAAGYYSGLLIAKLSKFNSLKYEALRVVRGINYIGDRANTQILKSDKVDDLHLIASELLHLKHKMAGRAVLRISVEVSNVLASCGEASYPAEQIMKDISNWQQQLRELRVSPRVGLPWGQI